MKLLKTSTSSNKGTSPSRPDAPYESDIGYTFLVTEYCLNVRLLALLLLHLEQQRAVDVW